MLRDNEQELLEELLMAEIARLDLKLRQNQKSRELRLSWGHATDIHDLTERRLYARLALANETLGQLIDWSNN